MPDTYLVTGAYGCIGAWAVRELVRADRRVVTYDLGGDPYRLRLIMTPDELERVAMVQGDITDLAALERTMAEHEVTRVVHLAALQVPFCRANPPLGAAVNVQGTANVLEAVRKRPLAGPLVYASSIAVYGTEGDSLPDVPEQTGPPSTIYGVYKRANEGSARIYWEESQVPSIGLRPHTVYGPGRDQGVTSAPTVAMLAAAAGRGYRIPFATPMQLQHVADVARAFVRAAELDGFEGAAVHNLGGTVAGMEEIVAILREEVPESDGLISFDPVELPFPSEVDSGSFAALFGDGFDTPLREGVRAAVAHFRELVESGTIPADRLPGS